MINPIYIHIVTEDALSTAVLRKLISESGRPYIIGFVMGEKGKTYIDIKLRDFNNTARTMPFFILRDLDTDTCAPQLIRTLFSFPKYQNLLFRVAVKEVEAWLLADKSGFSSYLGISANRIDSHVEAIFNPKEYLINLVRNSRKRELIYDIVPMRGSTAKQGRNYNNRLIDFVNNLWNIQKAMENSDSLRKAFLAIKTFSPLLGIK